MDRNFGNNLKKFHIAVTHTGYMENQEEIDALISDIEVAKVDIMEDILY